jgi:hypothetical protein
MELIKENYLPFLIELITLIVIYFILVYLFKRFNYKISKEKIASLVLLLLVFYYVLSILLGIFFKIDI